MPEIPTPIRAYLGLLDTIVANGRGLVGRTPELPAILVGNALQLSMRATQTYTELATRGDLVLSRLHRAPEESPSWATFDDELNAAASPSPASLTAVPDGAARRAGLIDAEPFAPPATSSAPVHTAPVITLAPGKTVAPAKKVGARRTPASKATATKSTATKTTASKATASKATASMATASNTPANTTPTKSAPVRTGPANRAAAPAKATVSPTRPRKQTAASRLPVKRAAAATGTSASTHAAAREQLDQLELDPRAGAGNGGARPQSAFDRVGRLTDDLLAEVATAENDIAENDTAENHTAKNDTGGK